MSSHRQWWLQSANAPIVQWEKQTVVDAVKLAVDFRAVHGVRVCCGEFGAFIGAPAASRQRWAADVLDVLETNAIDSIWLAYEAGTGTGWTYETPFESTLTIRRDAMKTRMLSAMFFAAVITVAAGCGGGGGGGTPAGSGAPATLNGTRGAQIDYQSAIIKSVIPTPVVIPLPSQRATASNKTYFGRYQYVRNIAVIDVNGDGLDDLFVVPTFFDQYPLMPVEIWINQGDGRFAEQTAQWIDGPITVSSFSTAIRIVDFNNDGRHDVFMSSSGLEDLDCFNPGCDGGTNSLLLSQPNGKLKDVTATNLPSNTAAFNHVVSAIGDVNGDGLVDIVVPRLGGPKLQSDGVVLYLNQGAGSFALAATGAVPDEVAFLPFSSLGGRPASFDRQSIYSSAIADVDGDGKAELITCSGGFGDVNTNDRTVRIFKWNAATNKLAEAARFSIAPALKGIQNIGFPGAQLPPPEHNGLGCSHVSVADFDADGKPDILLNWESWTENYVQLMRSRGSLAFEDVTLAAFGAYKTSYTNLGNGWTILDQQFQDVNGDGLPDIFMGSGGNSAALLSAGSPAAAWINSGNGTFKKQQLTIQGSTASTDAVSAYLGCDNCGVTYYGRFVRRTDNLKTQDMVLVGVEALRQTPVAQEASMAARVVPAR